jgi:hypothetical protein
MDIFYDIKPPVQGGFFVSAFFIPKHGGSPELNSVFPATGKMFHYRCCNSDKVLPQIKNLLLLFSLLKLYKPN